MDVEKLAASVRPTCRLEQRLVRAIVEALESCITVGLQDAAKIFEMFPRPLAFAIGRIAKQHGWWISAAGRLIISYVGPQSPVFVLPVPGASTGIGVSSACSLCAPITYSPKASINGAT